MNSKIVARMTVILINVYSVRKQRWWNLWSASSHNLDSMPRELELIEVEPVDQVLVGSNLQRIIAQDWSKWLLWQSRETPAIWFFFTIYLSSNLGSGLGTRLSFKVLILTEKKFLYTVLFIFSPGRAVHSQTRLKRSESQQWWSSLKNPATEMF